MKKRVAKLLALVIALVLAVSMTIGASAFTGEYFETTELWDYTEEETVIGNSVEAVIGTETYAVEDAVGLNNYNVYALEMDIEGYGAQQLYDESGDAFENEFKTALQSQYNAMGWSVEFVSFNKSLEIDNYDFYQYILLESEQKLTDASGNVTTVYQNMAIYPANTYAVYVTVTNYNSAQECKDVLDKVAEGMWIEDYCYGEGYNGLTEEELEFAKNLGMGIVIGALVFFLVIIIVVIIVVVVVVKSSKKKKAQRAAQQYNPYGYNPNMQYNPYGQYNSNGQAPVNDGQNNPYGQQPPVNNNQYNTYNPQNNTYVPYTPVQPATSETKDPLDLDNKE